MKFLREFWNCYVTLAKRNSSNKSIFIISTVKDKSRREVVVAMSSCILRLLSNELNKIDNVELISFERKYILYVLKTSSKL